MGIQINGQTDTVTAIDGSINIGGNVTVPGVLTYEDVTNIDAVGVITARSGLRVTGGLVGIGSDNPQAPLNVLNNNANTPTVWIRNVSGGGDSPALRVQGGANNNNAVGTFEVRDYDGNVDFKVGGTGNIGIGTDNPSSRLQILDIDGTTTITGSRGSGHSYKLETTGLNAEGFNIIDVDNAQRAWLYYAGANPATQSYHTFNTNGTEKLRVDASGRVTTPNQPCFWATSTSGSSNTTNGFTGIISNQFENAYTNVGGHYNTSTGVFTCPVAGVYQFHGQALLRYNTGNGHGELTFHKNGVNTVARSHGYTYMSAASDHDNLHVMRYMVCAANDQIDFRVHAMAAGCNFYYYEGLGYFAGRLVG